MIQNDPIKALYEYYQGRKNRCTDDPDITPYGWAYRPVSFEVIISLDGELVDIRRLGNEKPKDPNKPKSKAYWVYPEYLLPAEPPSRSGTNPTPAYLADNYKHVFGQHKERYSEVWSDLAALAPECKELQAVVKYYERYPSPANDHRVKASVAVESNGVYMFRIANGPALHEIPAVQSAVNKHIELELADQPKCICRLSGTEDTLCNKWHGLKGIKDGDGTGNALTYYKPESSQRYGYQQGYNALVGIHSEWAVWQAWCMLVKNAVVLGDTTYVCWTDDGSPADCILDLLRTVKQKGRYAVDDEDPNCYILGVKPAGRRGLMVTLYLSDKLSVFDRNIRLFNQIAESVGIDDDWRLIDVIHALNEYRDPGDVGHFDPKKIDHYFGEELLDMICNGRKVNDAWMSRVTRKYMQLIRKGYSCNRLSVKWLSVLLVYGLCKMGKEQTEDWSKTMNEVNDDKMIVYKDNPYWLLGRLIACVERMQELAVWGKDKSNIGNIYRRILSRAVYNPTDALQTVGNWYLTKYLHTGKQRCGGLAVNVHKQYQAIMDDLCTVALPDKSSTIDKACLLLGYQAQMTAFFKPKETEIEPETEPEKEVCE